MKIDHIEEIESLSRLALPEYERKAHALTKAIVKAQEHWYEEAKEELGHQTLSFGKKSAFAH